LEDVAEDGLGIIGVRDVLANAEDITALADVVLHIVVGALVC